MDKAGRSGRGKKRRRPLHRQAGGASQAAREAPPGEARAGYFSKSDGLVRTGDRRCTTEIFEFIDFCQAEFPITAQRESPGSLHQWLLRMAEPWAFQASPKRRDANRKNPRDPRPIERHLRRASRPRRFVRRGHPHRQKAGRSPDESRWLEGLGAAENGPLRRSRRKVRGQLRTSWSAILLPLGLTSFG